MFSVNDEPLVPEPSYFAIEITTEKFGRYKLAGIDQIFVEYILEGSYA
jgi:hypothetical protein